MTRRGSKHYDSPPSRIPDHIFERWQREDGEAEPVQTEAELREEIATLKVKSGKLEKIARDALEALSDYAAWDDFEHSLADGNAFENYLNHDALGSGITIDDLPLPVGAVGGH